VSTRTVVVTPVGAAWRDRALEAEGEVARLRERLAAVSKRETARWFRELQSAASARDRKRYRGHDPKVPLPLIAKLEAEGWQGEALAAKVREITKADERTAYRALKRWRALKKSDGLRFVVELDEHGRIVVTGCS
jgi:hypothetical protein